MAHDVFISYSTKDDEQARLVYNKLQESGIRCWFAPVDIPPADDWPPYIPGAIRSCPVMLLLFSPHSNQSRDVAKEVQMADRLEKIIFPFRLTSDEYSQKLEYALGNLQSIDASTGDFSTHVDELATKLQKRIARILAEAEKADSSSLLASPSDVTSADEDTPHISLLLEADDGDEVEFQSSDSEGHDDIEEVENDASVPLRKTNREAFLAQCDEHDRSFYEQLFSYCATHNKRAIIEWGTKGFSLKDKNKRPLIWMFPTREVWSVQLRSGSFRPKERRDVAEILTNAGIGDGTFTPREIGIERMLQLVSVLCRTPLETQLAAAPIVQEGHSSVPIGNSEATDLASSHEDAEVETESEEEGDDADYMEMTRESFLAQCSEADQAYFKQLFALIDKHPRLVEIGWNLRTIDVNDRRYRHLFRISPTNGARGIISMQEHYYTRSEAKAVKDILVQSGINKQRWRPAQLDIQEMLRIIGILCKISE